MLVLQYSVYETCVQLLPLVRLKAIKNAMTGIDIAVTSTDMLQHARV
jgi:hypothetical protein